MTLDPFQRRGPGDANAIDEKKRTVAPLRASVIGGSAVDSGDAASTRSKIIA
jgi:hypothetical protein